MFKAVIFTDKLCYIIQRTSFNKKNGLINDHAYSITKVCVLLDTKPISNNDNKITLIRLRNPWGNEHEWNGPWSDKYVLILNLHYVYKGYTVQGLAKKDILHNVL